MTRTPLERFKAKIQLADDGCWNWTGCLNSRGYGCFGDGGRVHLAHRWIYGQLVGDLEAGLQIDHLCRNKPCVNPAHLEQVTQTENMRRIPNFGPHRTHCPRGHEYSAANTIVKRSGNRCCRECNNARRREARGNSTLTSSRYFAAKRNAQPVEVSA